MGNSFVAEAVGMDYFRNMYYFADMGFVRFVADIVDTEDMKDP